ncbi:CapA family protein [Brevibacterium yomogidense]|uniref:UDP-N-acetylmuramoylalanyl-D-glutamyl-2,6-diaminopimelate--D-alanyl-D-alanine ligase n=1 Tax=Brevibacterium yomogidense TaxID=946573 RepID=A0A1X6X7R2_9MICO|nr:CapA family protein [Brevibacterium yomogidense]SLM95160.1 UDP-N-acetylmuramoylalanyl-D-glutamyl-2,6-diaminopimelate--D-alanyl-D-alanine ligase [Brevibacterium yomogidense]
MADDKRTPGHRVARTVSSTLRSVKRGVGAFTDSMQKEERTERADVSSGQDASQAAPLARPAEERAPMTRTVELDGVSYRPTASGMKVVGVRPDATESAVHSDVEGVPVTVIGKGAFKDRTGLTAVTLPETIITVGAEAFAGCTGLTEVELPSDLQVVNAQAFEGCTSLRTVWLPADLTRIARRAFADCSALETVPHYVKRGIGTVLAVDRTMVEEALPTNLVHMGDEAFRGCASLRRIVVPFQVTEIPASSFEGCSSLESVWLHSNVSTIGDRAFAGCRALARLRVPENTQTFGDAVIDAATTVVGAEGSAALTYARERALAVEPVSTPSTVITSVFGSDQGLTVEELLESADSMEDFVERYEVRPPTHEIVRDDASADAPPVESSRFVRDGGVYRPAEDRGAGDVTISMVGDLMCGIFQQHWARREGRYGFEGAFDDIEELLAPADLSIGNLEAMIAPSYEYMHLSRYVEDRPNLNAPPAFLSAVRNAGFDVVMNAQNHMFDTGTKGVLETLAALNSAELIHGGMYAHIDEPRHILFDIRGMRIAVVAYLDPARQKMKQANFTDEGIATFASHFSEEKVRADIAAARRAGAEFVLAYCHWGREYTDRITQKQAGYAQMVVDAGADYVFGSHSHCPQPYTVMRSQDGRRVPVVYSGGNFLSDITRSKPITDDTFVASLTLTRDAEGRVVIADDGYTPCRILTSRSFRGYSRVVPLEKLLDGAYDYSPVDAEADIRRIEATMGHQYARLQGTGGPAVTRDGSGPAADEDAALVEAYSLREPPFAVQQAEQPQDDADFVRDDADGVWKRTRDAARGEAVIMCGGSLTYDRSLERNAHAGDAYEFRTHFRHVRAVLEEADLAVGSLGTMVADMFPAMSTLPKRYVGRHYVNARSEYVDALAYAGFDCLALANPYNLDGGVRGVSATERAVRDHGVVPSGLGRERNPVFDVNGVRIAVLSHTVNAYRVREVVTAEGATELLNVLDEDAVRQTISDARAAGAQFVLSYLDCRAIGTQLRRTDRLEAAKIMAECGADYVVCTLPNVVSKYVSHMTSDGRTVPIATGLGTLMAGSGSGAETASALLRIAVRPGEDGGMVVDDSYIPLQRFHAYRGARGPVVAAHEYYNPDFAAEEFGDGPSQLAARLGDGIGLDRSRRVKIHSHYRPQMSPAQVAEVIGARFTETDRQTLGEAMEEPVHSIVVRPDDLAPGCIAVLAKRATHGRNFDEISIEAAVEAGALMTVSEEPHDDLPTLLVDDPWTAMCDVTAAIREQYSPFTVAVTGTAGKTTTKEMLAEVFERHFRTLNVEGNYNTMRTAGLVVQKLAADDEAYIQEVHGGSLGAARMLSTVISPDVCLITSIGEAHLEQMGSLEAIVEGKMQIIDGMRPGGTLILNDDSPHLQAQTPDVRTVRYSLQDRDVDYRARDIRRVGDALEFEIVAPDGVHFAVVNSRGMHNVSNVLGVFAAGREAGIPAQTIIAGISRYRPSSTRQNLVQVGGYSLLVDAYNSNPISLESGVETLCEIPIANGGRRVAVLGDMGEQGERFEENHRAAGDMLAQYPVDLVLSSGPGMKLAAERLRSQGTATHHYDDFDALAASLHSEISPEDVVLFKAAGSVDLEKKVVYPVFGRII